MRSNILKILQLTLWLYVSFVTARSQDMKQIPIIYSLSFGIFWWNKKHSIWFLKRLSSFTLASTNPNSKKKWIRSKDPSPYVIAIFAWTAQTYGGKNVVLQRILQYPRVVAWLSWGSRISTMFCRLQGNSKTCTFTELNWLGYFWLTHFNYTWVSNRQSDYYTWYTVTIQPLGLALRYKG